MTKPFYTPKKQHPKPSQSSQTSNVSTQVPNPIREKKRKIKFLDKEWIVFEEVDPENEEAKLWASHYCAGSEEFQKAYERANGRKKLPFFNKAVNVDETDRCKDCEKEIPKEYLMAIKINNLKI